MASRSVTKGERRLECDVPSFWDRRQSLEKPANFSLTLKEGCQSQSYVENYQNAPRRNSEYSSVHLTTMCRNSEDGNTHILQSDVTQKMEAVYQTTSFVPLKMIGLMHTTVL